MNNDPSLLGFFSRIVTRNSPNNNVNDIHTAHSNIKLAPELASLPK